MGDSVTKCIHCDATVLSTSQPDRARTATVLSLADAVKNYFAVWDRCGGDESVAADEFAQGRQAMRAAIAATETCCYGTKPLFDCQCEKDRNAVIAECELAARGAMYEEIYNGDPFHNWSRDSEYGRGRHAAADAVRALAATPAVGEDYQRGYIDGVEWAMVPATPAVGGEREALADRIAVYLDDTPHGGGHSDAAGANCWELLEEAMQALRPAAQTASPLRGREEIARIIDPTAFVMRPGAYGLKTEREMLDQTMVGVIRRMALQKADAILALASPPEQPAAPDKETFK